MILYIIVALFVAPPHFRISIFAYKNISSRLYIYMTYIYMVNYNCVCTLASKS